MLWDRKGLACDTWPILMLWNRKGLACDTNSKSKSHSSTNPTKTVKLCHTAMVGYKRPSSVNKPHNIELYESTVENTTS